MEARVTLNQVGGGAGDAEPQPLLRPSILIVMGVTGTGKSSVARELARILGWELQEGDDLHPRSNVEKMAAGQPLDDHDREPWLARIAEWIQTRSLAGQTGVITCSALKRAYRDRIAAPGAVFIHIHGDQATIAERLAQRAGHFMDPTLLASQLDTLEPLAADEPGIVVGLETSPDKIAISALGRLGLLPA